jgi:hypothetical protein
VACCVAHGAFADLSAFEPWGPGGRGAEHTRKRRPGCPGRRSVSTPPVMTYAPGLGLTTVNVCTSRSEVVTPPLSRLHLVDDFVSLLQGQPGMLHDVALIYQRIRTILIGPATPVADLDEPPEAAARFLPHGSFRRTIVIGYLVHVRFVFVSPALPKPSYLTGDNL